MNTPVNTPSPENGWRIGTAEIDISPLHPVFLYGYPHVPRTSTGINDPLLASAMWLECGSTRCLFIGCDLIWLPKRVTQQIRADIGKLLDLPPWAIMITATHTHSGPVTSTMLSNTADPVVPAADETYLRQLVDQITTAANLARDDARPASLHLGQVDSEGFGGNRRDPNGPALAHWPVLYASEVNNGPLFAVMTVCAMHPTVLHEDSTLISGDFPGLARRTLKHNTSPDVLYLHHMGACGNLSPRRAVEANTMAEAERLGTTLASRILDAQQHATPLLPQPITVQTVDVELPLRQFPRPERARELRDAAIERLEHLRATSTDKAEIRTAECDWFGAEETLTLAQAAADQRLEQAAESCMPGEIQLLRIGELSLLAWPGEVFVEFAQEVQAVYPNAHVITLANGELQGYLVTQQAVEESGYEANNALFASPESGRRFVEASLGLLNESH